MLGAVMRLTAATIINRICKCRRTREDIQLSPPIGSETNVPSSPPAMSNGEKGDTRCLQPVMITLKFGKVRGRSSVGGCEFLAPRAVRVEFRRFDAGLRLFSAAQKMCGPPNSQEFWVLPWT